MSDHILFLSVLMPPFCGIVEVQAAFNGPKAACTLYSELKSQ
ncbi:hypothetical protein [Kingella denitrificans]|nr:hypothetical protein [Kingella denitrificans]